MEHCKNGIFLSILGWPLRCGLVKKVKQIFVEIQYVESNKFCLPVSMVVMAFTVAV